MTDWSAALAQAFDRHLRVYRGNTETALDDAEVSRRQSRQRQAPAVFPGGETGKTTKTDSETCALRHSADDAIALLEERVAFVEVSAGVPADWAEAFVRLDLATALDREPGGRASQMMDDAGRFLDRWAQKAAALGWSAGDIFGRDGDTSDSTGLVHLINGGVVESIKAERASIRMPDGSTVVYLRRPRTVLWERSDE